MYKLLFAAAWFFFFSFFSLYSDKWYGAFYVDSFAQSDPSFTETEG